MKQSLQDFRLSLSLKAMLWVGLTGCMGCGKSTVASILKAKGFPVLSADEVVKSLYQEEEVADQIKKEFHLDLGLSKEELIKSLSKNVFKDKEKLYKLEAILHPLVRKRVEEIKEGLDAEIAFYDVPLLFEKNMQGFFDRIICVGLNIKEQEKRIKMRNPDWSDREIQDRMSNQLDINLKEKKSDFYINNDGSLEDLEEKVEVVLNNLKR